MSPEQLTLARGAMMTALQQANASGSWLAVVFIFDKSIPDHIGVGCGLAGEGFEDKIEAITRGMARENLPAINQAMLTKLEQSGVRIVSGKQQANGLFIPGNGQAAKIIDPTKM